MNKLAIVVLILSFGILTLAYAQEQHEAQKESESHSKPAKAAKPAKEVKQEKQEAKSSATKQEKSDKVSRQDTRPLGETGQHKATPHQAVKHEAKQHQTAPQAAAKHQGGSQIPADHYKAHFGQEHKFRVNNNHNFQYGGYSFTFVGVWPNDWLYTQDVYVIEIDGVYYLCNQMYPGVNVEVAVAE